MSHFVAVIPDTTLKERYNKFITSWTSMLKWVTEQTSKNIFLYKRDMPKIKLMTALF